jgi:hypothetical protein
MVEMAAVVDGGRRLVEITYEAESKHPMVFVMYLLLQVLIQKIQYNETPSARLDLACQAAATLMQEAMAPLRESVEQAKRVEAEYEVIFEAAQEAALLAQEAAITAQQQVQQTTTTEEATTQPRTSGRSRQQHNYANMHRGGQGVTAAAAAADVDNSADNNQTEEDGQPPIFHFLQEAAATYKEKARNLTRQEQQLELFLLQNSTSPADFFEHGTMAVESGFNYFLEKFAKANGPYTSFMKMLRAAELFNPMRAKIMTVNWMVQRVEELKAFGFPEFLREKMQDGMKGELDTYHKHIQGMFDWDGVPGAIAYNKSLEKKNNLVNNNEITTWQDDPKEVARRVWEWWVENNDNYHYLSTAVRLVVLVQTSSAAAERAFSQLGLILDAVGNTALDDVVELRLFERANRNKYKTT